MKHALKKFILEISGAIVVAFAVTAPVVMGAAGMALDYSHAYLVQQRLQQAVDSAALAAASSSTDPVEIEAKVREFFDKNYPPEKLGATFVPEVTVTNDSILVNGHAVYFTFFLNVIGIDHIDVTADTTVRRDVRGLEVALVLDNTGSMSDGNKIGALRTAATNFVNILYSHTTDPYAVKIGLVPYANSVRVGRYGLGKNPDGSTYDSGYTFVTLPSDVSYTTNHNASSGWYGCVVEHNDNDYSYSATYVAGSKGQLWKDGADWNGHGWDPTKTTNDPHPSDVEDEWEGPWDIYQYGTIGGTCSAYQCKTYSCSQYQCKTYQCQQYKCKTYYTSGSQKGQCKTYYTSGTSNCQTFYSDLAHCSTYYTDSAHCLTQGSCQTYYTDAAHCTSWSNFSFTANSTPNVNCPYTGIMPLNSDKTAQLAQIATMQAHGNTLGNVGAIWGYRLLSPERPFTEGVDWDDELWHKAVLIMTDGINTRDGTYSNFWAAAKNNLDTDDYNDRFLEVCDALKEKGVVVYTIILGTGGVYDEPDQTTKDFYKACASTEDQYFDAPSNEELIGVFEEISRELSNIYISQ